jgi:tetratricopeptide (TPR) repeat protein
MHAKGGLGEVLLVRDEQLNRDLALKLLPQDHDTNPDSRRRFLVEAQVTAQLEHPGIVPVHGLGQADDGRPCYAMRFIQGESLQEAIRAFHKADKPGRDPGERRLAFRQLLTQFITVCKTLAYAHSRGVLHRDLKPANIMLGKYGETLVVDWGLAKRIVGGESFAVGDEESESGSDRSEDAVATGDGLRTATGDVIGTPAYMSPEQARGESLGPASDIYSLGATLYVVLTGVAPIEAENGHEQLAKAREGDFRAPRQRKKDVPLTLERICLKAMALRLEARYGSVLELAEDVEHWLADEPVAAYPDPWPGRLRRWGRRHRALVTALAAALMVGLLGLGAGLIVVTGLNRRLDLANADLDARNADLVRANAKERQARERAQKVLGYFVDTFRRPDPSQDGEQVTVVEVLKRKAKELPGDADLDPLMRGALLVTIGQTYVGLGLPHQAVDALKQGLALYRDRLDSQNSDVLDVMNDLAEAYRSAGRLAEAVVIHEEILKVRKTKHGPEHHATLTSMNNLAVVYRKAGRLAEALALSRDTLELLKATLGPDHPNTLSAMNNLALAYGDAGRLSDALPLLEETLTREKAVLGPDHPNTLSSMNNLALMYKDLGRLADAILLLEETLKLKKAKLGPDHPSTLASMSNLGLAYQDAGRLSDALPLLEKTLTLERAKLGREHPDTLGAMNNLASAYLDAGMLAEGVALCEEALRLIKAWLGPEHPLTLKAMNNLATGYHDSGRLTETIALFEETLKLTKARWGPEHPGTLLSMNNLALAYKDAGQLPQALLLFKETLDLRRAKLGPEHPETLRTVCNLAELLQRQGKLTEAEALFRDLVSRRKTLSRSHRVSALSLAGLGAVLIEQGRPEEAEPFLRECLEVRREVLPKGHRLVADTEVLLGRCLTALGRYTEAEPLLLSGYETLKTAQAAPTALRTAMERIIQLYEAWSKPGHAAQWRAQLEPLIQKLDRPWEN